MIISPEERFLKVLFRPFILDAKERAAKALEIALMPTKPMKRKAVRAIVFGTPASLTSSPRWDYLQILVKSLGPSLIPLYLGILQDFQSAWKIGKINKVLN